MTIALRLWLGSSRRLRPQRPPNFRGQTVQETLDRYTSVATASFEARYLGMAKVELEFLLNAIAFNLKKAVLKVG